MSQAGEDKLAANGRRAELFRIYEEHLATWHVPTLVVTLSFEKAQEVDGHPETEPCLAYIRPELLLGGASIGPQI
jgi:hypothetical protein